MSELTILAISDLRASAYYLNGHISKQNCWHPYAMSCLDRS